MGEVNTHNQPNTKNAAMARNYRTEKNRTEQRKERNQDYNDSSCYWKTGTIDTRKVRRFHRDKRNDSLSLRNTSV